MQELICRNEEKLKATMADKQKELFALASHQQNNRKLDRRRRSLIVMFESCAPQSVREVTISGDKPYSAEEATTKSIPKSAGFACFPLHRNNGCALSAINWSTVYSALPVPSLSLWALSIYARPSSSNKKSIHR